MATKMLWNNARKKHMKAGLSQTSRIGISESVTLKHALRKYCISQASEMAAMKSVSKPSAVSDVSEVGTIKRVLASVVVPMSESGENRKLVQISLVGEKAMKDSESSNGSSVPSPHHAVSPTAMVQKTKIQDVIAFTENADYSSTLKTTGVKGKPFCKNYVHSYMKGVDLNKLTTGSCQIKPVKTNTKRKGKQELGSALVGSNNCTTWIKMVVPQLKVNQVLEKNLFLHQPAIHILLKARLRMRQQANLMLLQIAARLV